jgi:Ring finger domain
MITEQQQKRIDKLKEDEFYLIGFDGKEEILMTGSKKDVYTVNLKKNGSMTCNCPDSKNHAKKHGVVCKHVCFIYLKICKGTDMEFFDHKKLNDSNLEKLKARTKALTNSDIAKTMYKSYLNQTTKVDGFDKATKVEAADEEFCPICFDDLSENVKYCPECSKPVHEKCIEKWLQQHNTCIYCRSDVWKQYHNDGANKKTGDYVKVA